MAPAVVKWMDEDPRWSLANVANDLTRVIKTVSDGYQIARDLEMHFFYNPDPQLVEILQRETCHIDRAYDEAVRAWVEANKIALSFKVGETVRTEYGPGLIVPCRPEVARYVVAVTEEQRGLSGGYLLDSENVTLQLTVPVPSSPVEGRGSSKCRAASPCRAKSAARRLARSET